MFVRKILKNEGNSVDDSAVDAGFFLLALVYSFSARWTVCNPVSIEHWTSQSRHWSCRDLHEDCTLVSVVLANFECNQGKVSEHAWSDRPIVGILSPLSSRNVTESILHQLFVVLSVEEWLAEVEVAECKESRCGYLSAWKCSFPVNSWEWVLRREEETDGTSFGLDAVGLSRSVVCIFIFDYAVNSKRQCMLKGERRVLLVGQRVELAKASSYLLRGVPIKISLVFFEGSIKHVFGLVDWEHVHIA